MTVEAEKVVGKALYMEFRNGSQTYQALVTPDTIASNGRAVPAVLYRRQISSSAPRKAWKTTSFPTLNLDAFGKYEARETEAAAASASARMVYVENLFTRIQSYGYFLYKAPIVVEVSQEDVEAIRLSKTPYKILGRITRVRRTLGFGEALFN